MKPTRIAFAPKPAPPRGKGKGKEQRRMHTDTAGRRCAGKIAASCSSLLLEVALDFDRIFRIASRTALDARLFVAFLGAGDRDVFRVDVLAEARDLVDAHDVGTGHQRAAILQRGGHLGVGNARSINLADKSEVGWAV